MLLRSTASLAGFDGYLTSLGADEDTHRALHVAWDEWREIKQRR